MGLNVLVTIMRFNVLRTIELRETRGQEVQVLSQCQVTGSGPAGLDDLLPISCCAQYAEDRSLRPFRLVIIWAEEPVSVSGEVGFSCHMS